MMFKDMRIFNSISIYLPTLKHRVLALMCEDSTYAESGQVVAGYVQFEGKVFSLNFK